MKKTVKIWLAILAGAIVLILLRVFLTSSPPKVKERLLSAEPVLIGHAMGGIKDAAYSNSLEAFKKNYRKGLRIFEADFATTSDNKLVLRHDWKKKRGQKGLLKEEGYIPTYDEFMNTPLYGKYTPLSLADVFQLMKRHPDVLIITDTKSDQYDKIVAQFQLLKETAEETDSMNCLDRFIIQLYNDEMYDAVTSVYPFKVFIYTVYQRGTDNFEQLCQFCVENDIKIVTMNQNKFKDEFMELIKQYDLKLFLHTVNDPEKANRFHDKGVSGFYTDILTDKDFE